MGRRSPESGHACQIRVEQGLAEGWDDCYGQRLSLEGRIELLAPYQGRATRWPGNGKSVAAPAGCREPHRRDFWEGGVLILVLMQQSPGNQGRSKRRSENKWGRVPHPRGLCEGAVFEFSTQRRAQLIGPGCHRLTVR